MMCVGPGGQLNSNALCDVHGEGTYTYADGTCTYVDDGTRTYFDGNGTYVGGTDVDGTSNTWGVTLRHPSKCEGDGITKASKHRLLLNTWCKHCPNIA